MFWKKKRSSYDFDLSGLIDVKSVDEEYKIMDSLLSEAGAPFSMIDRSSSRESVESENMIDQFTLRCTESGIEFMISFRVKY